MSYGLFLVVVPAHDIHVAEHSVPDTAMGMIQRVFSKELFSLDHEHSLLSAI